MKPLDVRSDDHIEYNVNFNDKSPKFKIGDHVRISKHKKVFAKGYTLKCSEEVFVITKIKCTGLWNHVNDLNG